jgi:hypothetical protein
MKKCDTCAHQGVCMYKEAYSEYYDKCNLTSEHADKFKVTVDCVHYSSQPCQGGYPSQGKITGIYIGDVVPNPNEITCK